MGTDHEVACPYVKRYPMIIFGIDPGSLVTGYGIIRFNGRALEHIDNGSLFADRRHPLSLRLHFLYRSISQLLEEYRPQAVAIEEIFLAKNAKSAMTLGHARGVAMLAAVEREIAVSEYSAREVKQALVGHGGASKEQIQQMTKALLKLPQIAQEDAADALAVAICHGHSANMKKILAARTTR